jgi:hypothetical protein
VDGILIKGGSSILRSLHFLLFLNPTHSLLIQLLILALYLSFAVLGITSSSSTTTISTNENNSTDYFGNLRELYIYLPWWGNAIVEHRVVK